LSDIVQNLRATLEQPGLVLLVVGHGELRDVISQGITEPEVTTCGSATRTLCLGHQGPIHCVGEEASLLVVGAAAARGAASRAAFFASVMFVADAAQTMKHLESDTAVDLIRGYPS
jgi:hypothetical protein